MSIKKNVHGLNRSRPGWISLRWVTVVPRDVTAGATDLRSGSTAHEPGQTLTAAGLPWQPYPFSLYQHATLTGHAT